VRTTLDIEDDILQAAREMAEQQGSTAGRVLSALARRGLYSQPARGKAPKTRGGVPILPSRGDVITLEKVKGLMDEEGI
jgi:hypothetical protein